jgi:hypothetical protein
MTSTNIHIGTSQAVCHYISSWLSDTPRTQLQLFHVDISEALSNTSQAQNIIGWHNFMKGRITKQWVHLYHCIGLILLEEIMSCYQITISGQKI